MVMNTEVIVAIIGGIVALIVALVNFFSAKKTKSKENDQLPLSPSSDSTSSFSNQGKIVIDGNNNQVTDQSIQAGRDVNIYHGANEKQFEALRQIINKQDWDATKENSAFRKFVRAAHQGKNVEQLDNYSKATFWEDLERYLAIVEEAEANAQRVMQVTMDGDLKALFPKIEAARANFDYNEVNRLLSSFEEKHAEQTHDLARVFYLKAQNYDLQINYPEAERYYKKAAAIEDQDAFYLNEHAYSLETLGRYGEAEPLYHRSLAIREAKLGAEHPYVAASLNNLAELLRTQGKYGEAEPLYRRALAIWEAKLGAEHPDVAASLNNLAELLRTQGKYGEAEPLYRRSLAIWEAKLGAEHPDVATSLNNLAALLYQQSKYGEAEPLYRRALAIVEAKLGADHPSVATSLNNLAKLLRTQGKYGEAESMYRRSLAIREAKLGAYHPDVAQSLNNLAALLETQGKYGEAEGLYRRSLAIMEAKLGKDHPSTVTVRENMNALLEKMK